jgi:hypothetical protein
MKFLRIAVLAALAAPLWAGGVQLSLGNPAAVDDPAARGALVTVRLSSHGSPVDNAMLTATAEGIVNGERVSQPVKLTPLAKARLVAIHWTRPAEGTWVLRFSLGSDTRYLHVPVESAVLKTQTLDFRYADSTDHVLAMLSKTVKTAKR